MITTKAQVRKLQAVLHFRERRQMKLGAIKIQQYFRCYSQVLKFNSMKDDIVRLQAHIRGFLQRQKQHSYNKAAVSIQAIWRGYSNYTQYIHNIGKVFIIQSYVRMFLAKKDRMKRTQAVITIQMLARRWCSIRTLNRLRQEYGELMRSIDAATVIQVRFLKLPVVKSNLTHLTCLSRFPHVLFNRPGRADMLLLSSIVTNAMIILPQ